MSEQHEMVCRLFTLLTWIITKMCFKHKLLFLGCVTNLAFYFLTISCVVADYFKIYLAKCKPLKKCFSCFSFSILYTHCSVTAKNI